MNEGKSGSIWWCNTAGLFWDPEICAIKSQAQIRQDQIDELARTSMTSQNQAAAVSGADATIQADYASHPGDYAGQEAVAANPFWSALFGPGEVAWLTGKNGDPSGSSSIPGWAVLTFAVGAVLVIKQR